MSEEKNFSAQAEIGGKIWNWSCGKFAPLANGSVTVRVGDTVVMATAVISAKPRDGIDYLPLMVDYEEKLYAAGKIKGSRWVKREGRPTDEAILTSRVIDRGLRPMFNGDIRNDIQVVATVLSVDGENDPDMIAINAASAAVEISDIPWNGPIAGVRVGRVNGDYILNPSYAQVNTLSKLDLIVVGTEDHIIMVEAGASEVTEEEIIEAVRLAQPEIKKNIQAIKALAAAAGQEKREIEMFAPDEEIGKRVFAREAELAEILFGEYEKKELDFRLNAFFEKLDESIAADDPEKSSQVKHYFEKLMKKAVQEAILKEEKRVGGRKLNEIRKIESEVGLLPRVHGSGLFKRGYTQVLTTVTLGGPGDVQLLEDIDTEEERKKRYIHHYNFPAFSVGETRPMRSPGRREIGHGALAERALESMLPPKDSFPYTLRLVSEVLSSDGSTSMASTCGSTLALMDAGIPIKNPVSGIAMGLVMDEKTGEYKVLSDIQALEDFNGHMDFKVAGTKNGINALQLDIKTAGLTLEILEDALKIAKEGRLFILGEMLKIIPKPREEMSKYAPRIVAIKIDPSKIRDVIGTGGKIINEIIEKTGVEIDIEDDGTVMVTSSDAEGSKRALEWIHNLTRDVKAGEEFEGKVTRLMDFGAFVEVLPGKEGLVHISELDHYRVNKVEDVLRVGDKVRVKVLEIDNMGRINLSRKALIPRSDSAGSAPGGGKFGDFPEKPKPRDFRGRRFIAKDRKY